MFQDCYERFSESTLDFDMLDAIHGQIKELYGQKMKSPILQHMGRPLDPSQSLFYFVPQEISQPDWLGYFKGTHYSDTQCVLHTQFTAQRGKRGEWEGGTRHRVPPMQ